MSLPGFCLAVWFTAFAQGSDLDGDGLDDVTRAPVPSPEAPDPFASGPIHVIDIGALGVPGPVNSATWQFDETAQAPNGARGYLWVGATGGPTRIFKIDTQTPALVAWFGLPVSPEGLGWDGINLVVQSPLAIHLVDPLTGELVSTVPLTGGDYYGTCWRPSLDPAPDEYTWSTIFSLNQVVQHRHFTGVKVSTLSVSPSAIGSLTDGKSLWTSHFRAHQYRQWDTATGNPIYVLDVSAVNNNPRDGTWDGHHLWDVTWVNGGFAWQWDLYPQTGLYPVTVNLRPKAITAAPGGNVVVRLGLKNHTSVVRTASVHLDLFDATNALVNDSLIQRTLQPGETQDFSWTKRVPAAWSPGDLFKVRAKIVAPTEPERAEDWAILRIL